MWWCLGVVGVGLVGWTVFSVRRILYPERHPSLPPRPLPTYTTHLLAGEDRRSFDVWLLEAEIPRARVLLLHGYYANRFQVIGIAEGLRRRGYETLLFELRGHGSRAGPCTFGLKETGDALAALRWAQARKRVAPLPTGVLGFSLGAAVACQIASASSEIRALVADSVYSQLFPVLQRAIRERYSLPGALLGRCAWAFLQLALHRRLSRVDPLALAPSLHQPLLLIQGGKDQRVPPRFSEAFYERWAGPKERWFDPNVPHVGMFSAHPETYCERIAQFFSKALKS